MEDPQIVLRKNFIYIFLFLGIPVAWLASNPSITAYFIRGIDTIFSQLVSLFFHIIFFSIGDIPLVVLWLIGGAIFFTLRTNFVNVRAFRHAIDIVRGKYDHPEEAGEVSHFQALATALSATVGLGNIAGVAIAITLGGPGAVFWMTVAGVLGMSSKFVECTLAQKYRTIKPDGTVAGGPMYYLDRGLAELGQAKLGKVLAVIFSLFAIAAALGSASMFQANQSYSALTTVVPQLPGWLYGGILALLVALVILGGIQRIGRVAGTLVPAMCGVYVLAALWVLALNFQEIPHAATTILTDAFSLNAAGGGLVGSLVQGLRRSAFSNEAGIGSAAIAHSAAKTKEPIREGMVALLEPFIDTVIICNLTALVILTTGVHQSTDDLGIGGAQLTAAAFGAAIDWFPNVLALAVLVFAFSTMISWGYYGERSWSYLFGDRSLVVYRVLFVLGVFTGAIVNSSSVLQLSDGILYVMSFPNLIGAYLLSNSVVQDLDGYMLRLQAKKLAIRKADLVT